MVFSNSASKENSSYVKCGYCSEYYLKGCMGNHSCFLESSDSIFGNETKRSSTIWAHNVFSTILKAA